MHQQVLGFATFQVGWDLHAEKEHPTPGQEFRSSES